MIILGFTTEATEDTEFFSLFSGGHRVLLSFFRK